MADNLEVLITTKVDDSNKNEIAKELQNLVDSAQKTNPIEMKIESKNLEFVKGVWVKTADEAKVLSSQLTFQNKELGTSHTLYSKINKETNELEHAWTRISQKQVSFVPEFEGQFSPTKMQNYANSVSLVNSKFSIFSQISKEATSAQNNLNRALVELKGTKNIEDQNAALGKLKLAIQDANKEFKNLIPKDKLDVQTLSNRIQTWMNNNTTAAKQFSSELERVNQLLKGDVNVAGYNQAKKVFAEVKTSAEAMGIAGDTMSEKISKMFLKFSQWFGITRVIMEITNLFKTMISTIVEIDTAMTELRRVTDETDATYTKFLEGTNERARNLGATISDVVKASADFARLGYSIEDATILADIAIMYKNVGDGINNINEASSSIISTMKAFGIEAKDAMQIVDKFNEVGLIA